MRYQAVNKAAPQAYDQAFMRELVNVLNNLVRALNIKDLNDRESIAAYTLTNVTEDRTLDADSTSTAELADVLSTVINDLKIKGILE